MKMLFVLNDPSSCRQYKTFCKNFKNTLLAGALNRWMRGVVCVSWSYGVCATVCVMRCTCRMLRVLMCVM
jgi:hypothetical protein